MKQTKPLSRAIATICRKHLFAAQHALDSCKGEKSGRAVHDYRVALRRFRTLTSALRDADNKKAVRDLNRSAKKVVDTTSRVRDLEVLQEWLQSSWKQKDAQSRPSYESLINFCKDERQSAQEKAIRKLSKKFPNFTRKAGRALKDAEKSRDAREFGSCSAIVVQDRQRALEDKLSSPKLRTEDKTLHEVRILAKELRYLVEPFKGTPSAQRAISKLRMLQDYLGKIHDLFVVKEELANIVQRLCVVRGEALADFVKRSAINRSEAHLTDTKCSAIAEELRIATRCFYRAKEEYETLKLRFIGSQARIRRPLIPVSFIRELEGSKKKRSPKTKNS